MASLIPRVASQSKSLSSLDLGSAGQQSVNIFLLLLIYRTSTAYYPSYIDRKCFFVSTMTVERWFAPKELRPLKGFSSQYHHQPSSISFKCMLGFDLQMVIELVRLKFMHAYKAVLRYAMESWEGKTRLRHQAILNSSPDDVRCNVTQDHLLSFYTVHFRPRLVIYEQVGAWWINHWRHAY